MICINKKPFWTKKFLETQNDYFSENPEKHGLLPLWRTYIPNMSFEPQNVSSVLAKSPFGQKNNLETQNDLFHENPEKHGFLPLWRTYIPNISPEPPKV